MCYNRGIIMDKTWFDKQFARALKAGQQRRYTEAITILEDLAARGLADGSSPEGQSAGDSSGHPEVYLYLSRAWHAERMYARAAVCACSYIALRSDDGSGWFFLGRTYLSDGSCDRAVQALRKSVSLNPDSVDARALLGTAYLKCRKPSLARVVFEEALTLAPDDERLNQGYLNALFIEAVRSYKRGDAETARQMLTFLINNDIDGVAPRLYLAHALRDLGYLPEALGEYENAIEFAPDDDALKWYPVSVLLDLGETDKAAQLMSALGESQGEGALSPEMVGLRIIRNHLERESWAAAAQDARSYIRQFGSSAQAHALMGEAQRGLGKTGEALNHFRRALELDRQNPAPRYGIMLVHLAARDWASLRDELDRAERAGADADTISYYRVLCEANLDEDPASILPSLQDEVRKQGAVPELLAALARTYFRLGLADLAIGWYERVVAAQGGNEEAFLGYLACCEELAGSAEGGSERLHRAYADYLGRWGDNQAIRRDFVRYLDANGRWEEAADQVEILVGQTGISSSDRQLALYRRKAGQYRKAAILYRNMLRKKPEDRVLLSSLVYCLDRMGETASALRLMSEANRAFKPDADTLLIEGRLFARVGDLDSALMVFRKVVDSYPRDERGWEEISAVYAKRGVPEMAATYAQKARDIRQRAQKSAAGKPAKSATKRATKSADKPPKATATKGRAQPRAKSPAKPPAKRGGS